MRRSAWWLTAVLLTATAQAGAQTGDGRRLTPHQETRMRALLDAMFAEARLRAARLAEAEARLRRVCAEGNADEATVRAAVAEAERARVEVRLAHLLTHLRTRDLL